MGGGHSHATEHSSERSLWIALALTTAFLVAEVIGGILTRSLALLSDAAHMFTDVTALVIALAAMRIGTRAADERRTFGYQRLEILAAAFNAVLLFVVAVYIVYEAYERLKNPLPIDSTGMLVIALIGLAVNLISMRLLRGGKEASLNVKGAYLEVWSDMLGSMGVIIGAFVIRWTDWRWFDSVVAVAIGLWVLPRTWVLLKESTNILLEGVPKGIDLNAVRGGIEAVSGVKEIHDLHVWAITSGKLNLTAHLILEPSITDERAVTSSVREMLESRFHIHHVTLQSEREHCESEHVHR